MLNWCNSLRTELTTITLDSHWCCCNHTADNTPPHLKFNKSSDDDKTSTHRGNAPPTTCIAAVELTGHFSTSALQYATRMHRQIVHLSEYLVSRATLTYQLILVVSIHLLIFELTGTTRITWWTRVSRAADRSSIISSHSCAPGETTPVFTEPFLTEMTHLRLTATWHKLV